ncbi:MAG: TlpA disulfide reductase family protein [Pseudomonadota bacterium]
MPMRLCLGFVGLILIAACGPAQPDLARGFLTENTPPPASAADIRGDGVLRDVDERPYGYGLLGETLPPFSANLAGGGAFHSASLRGRWTLAKVWGVWCSDCMADAPYVAQLAAELAQDPTLDFVSIHTPPSAARAGEAYGTFGSVEAYFDSKGYSYATALDRDASIRDLLEISWTPTYLLVDPGGVVRGFRTDLSVAGETPVADFLADIAAVREAAAPTDGQAAPDFLSIGPDGAGRLNASTVFTLPALERAFPGFVVRAGEGMAEGERYPLFEVFLMGGGDLVFTVEPGWDRGTVGRLITSHGGVSGPLRDRIGETRLADIPEAERAVCAPGAEENGDKLFCAAALDATFWRVFAAPAGFEGYFPEAAAEARLQGVLAGMRYLPENAR